MKEKYEEFFENKYDAITPAISSKLMKIYEKVILKKLFNPKRTLFS
ncbi:MAG: hypothetical protein JW754_05865 [Candidatus Aenigmarchaeota archaeon]|nr:hypothetical protein [Candidatus Aenigmarchaeota archaeon]